jgi:hypothetical protein
MKMDSKTLDRRRRKLNRDQGRLREFLTRRKDFQRALPLFLQLHGIAHAARLAPGIPWSFQDEVLRGLDPEQMRLLPKGGEHSIAWLLWHITRIEDVTLNLLVAGTPQVFDQGGWARKLGVDLRDVGNDMPPKDLATLNRTIRPAKLLAYRLAVGRRTRRILQTIRAEEIWEPVGPERKKRLLAERVVRPKAAWLVEYWCGRRKADLLLMPPTRHSYVHLNEIRLVRRLLPPAGKENR